VLRHEFIVFLRLHEGACDEPRDTCCRARVPPSAPDEGENKNDDTADGDVGRGRRLTAASHTTRGTEAEVPGIEVQSWAAGPISSASQKRGAG